MASEGAAVSQAPNNANNVPSDLPEGLVASLVDAESLAPHAAQATFLARRPTELSRAAREIGKYLSGEGGPEGPETIADAWLLLSVNHYNLEQERLLVLTDRALHRIKFDFLNGAVTSAARTPLGSVLRLQVGPLGFPENSILNKTYTMDISKRLGIRIFTGLAPPSFGARWNPWSKSMPYSTYRAHNAISENPGRGNDILLGALDRIKRACQAFNADVEVLVDERIEISSYANLWSQVHNEGYLGAQKVRGPVSF